jgi:hypothetical protein
MNDQPERQAPTPADLRQLIEERLNYGRSDEFSKLAASSLMMAYNDIAPSEFAFRETSVDALELRSSRGGAIDTRAAVSVIEHFTAAVAALGREILVPSTATAKLSREDYARAPLFLDVQSGGLILLRAEPPGLLMNEHPVEHISSRALDRLVNLLPESSRDQTAVNNALGARVTSRRAIKEVAEAAAQIGGIELVLRRQDEVVGASMSEQQAQSLRRQLNVREADTQVIQREGILDGARSRRRIFYLDVSSGESIEGIIDETLVEDVLRHLTRPVIATIERTRYVSKAGVPGRPVYRLTALKPITEIPGLI